MSGIDLTIPFQGAKYLSGELPLRQAQTAQTWANIPLLEAQTAREQAYVPYQNELTAKQQIENEQNRLILEKGIKPGFEGSSGLRNVPFQQDPALAAQPQQTQSSYAPPAPVARQPLPPAQPAVQPQPPPQPPPQPRFIAPDGTGSTALSRFGPSAYQVASADTGTMSDVGPSYYTTNTEAVPSPDGGPPGAPASTVMAQLRGGGQPGQPPDATGSGALVAQSGQYNPNGVSPNSVYMDGVGPVSRQTNRDYWIGVAKGGNPIEMKNAISLQRIRRLTEEASAAANPQDWNARVNKLYSEGLLDNHSANQLYNQFHRQDHYVKSLTTAADQLNAQIQLSQQGLRLGPRGLEVDPTAIAGTRAHSLATNTGLVKVEVPDYDAEGKPTGGVHEESWPANQIDERLRANPGARYPAQPGPQSSASPNATQKSFAETYMPMAQKVSQQTGIPAETVLAQAAMESDYGRRMPKNNFFGIGVTGGKTPTYQTPEQGFQAFADLYNRRYKNSTTTDRGPAAYGDTLAVSGYNPSTPGKPGTGPSYGQRVANFQTALGFGTQYAGPGVPPPGSPADAIVRGMRITNPNALAPGATPVAGAAPAPQGGVVQTPQGPVIRGPSKPGAYQQPTIETDQRLLQADKEIQSNLQPALLETQRIVPAMHEALDRLAKIPAGTTGTAAAWRNSVAGALKDFAPQWGKDLTSWITNNKIDPNSVGDMQALMKYLFQVSVGQESALTRQGGARLTEMFNAMLPNVNMQGATIKDMTNMLLVTNAMTADYVRGATEHFNRAAQWQPGEGRYQGLSVFDQQWNSAGGANAPRIYGAAANMLNGKPWNGAGVSTPEQEQAAFAIATRADPRARIKDSALPPSMRYEPVH